MTSEKEKKLEEILWKISQPQISLQETSDLADKFSNLVSNSQMVLDELSLVFKVWQKLQELTYETLDKWEKGAKFSNEELEVIKRSVKGAIFHAEIINLMIKDNAFIEYSKFKDDTEKIKKKAGKILEKFIDIALQHQKEHFRLDQTDRQFNSINGKSNQLNKKNYPLPLIISMGAVIVSLIGVIVFLLFKNNSIKKKNVK